MTIANLGRQHHRSLDSYFKSSWEDLYSFGVLSYYFILVSILLKLVVYVFKLVLPPSQNNIVICLIWLF